MPIKPPRRPVVSSVTGRPSGSREGDAPRGDRSGDRGDQRHRALLARGHGGGDRGRDGGAQAPHPGVVRGAVRAADGRGRAQHLAAIAGPVHGYSLMLHGLKRAESVSIQETGLGLHRLLGCGNFIPHKSVAAVGE